jgi:hypothetical protein
MSLPMASLSDMVSLNPADLVTKLKFLFIVVIALFGAMNVGAAIGSAQDARERHKVVRKLREPEAGYRQTEAGAWVWRFHLEPLQDDIDAPSGSGVRLTAILGIPFVRLRAALPDELLTTTMGDALGRRRGFSVEGLMQCMPLQEELMSTIRRPLERLSSSSRRLSASSSTRRISETTAADAAERADRLAKQAAQEQAAQERHRVRLEELVGTSLVLAFLQVATLVPVVQLAQLKSAAKAEFDGVLTPFGWDFEKTQTDFVTLVSPGSLNGRSRWLLRARFWRLLLSQTQEGFWDCSDNVAFALQARDAAEVATVPPSLLTRIRNLFGAAAEAFDEGDTPGHKDEACNGAVEALTEELQRDGDSRRMRASDGAHDAAELPPGKPAPAGARGFSAGGSSAPSVKAGDDPLACSVDAIIGSIPVRLLALKRDHPHMDVLRVWTTLCCCSLLQELPVSWIWGDGARLVCPLAPPPARRDTPHRPAGDLYEPQERTIVDAGRQWVERYASERPTLAAALLDDSVRKRSKRIVRAWRQACELRVAELRRTKAIREQMGLSHVHRVGTDLMRALITQHSTFACFLSEPLDGLQRWQMFVIIITLVCSQLLVNIWMCVARRIARAAAGLTRARRGQVLRESRELLCGAEADPGQRARRRRLPARGPVPRLPGQLRGPAGPVCRAAGAAGLPRRPGGLRVHRVPRR